MATDQEELVKRAKTYLNGHPAPLGEMVYWARRTGEMEMVGKLQALKAASERAGPVEREEVLGRIRKMMAEYLAQRQEAAEEGQSCEATPRVVAPAEPREHADGGAVPAAASGPSPAVRGEPRVYVRFLSRALLSPGAHVAEAYDFIAKVHQDLASSIDRLSQQDPLAIVVEDVTIGPQDLSAPAPPPPPAPKAGATRKLRRRLFVTDGKALPANRLEPLAHWAAAVKRSLEPLIGSGPSRDTVMVVDIVFTPVIGPPVPPKPASATATDEPILVDEADIVDEGWPD
jgi:hypothetical protein